MKELTLIELIRMTRIELFSRLREIANILPKLPELSPERTIAVTNLRRINRVLWWDHSLRPK